jgi:hypothetical protein
MSEPAADTDAGVNEGLNLAVGAMADKRAPKKPTPAADPLVDGIASHGPSRGGFFTSAECPRHRADRPRSQTRASRLTPPGASMGLRLDVSGILRFLSDGPGISKNTHYLGCFRRLR